MKVVLPVQIVIAPLIRVRLVLSSPSRLRLNRGNRRLGSPRLPANGKSVMPRKLPKPSVSHFVPNLYWGSDISSSTQTDRFVEQSEPHIILFLLSFRVILTMERTSVLAAHVNGSSMASTLVGTVGQTTEQRLAGEDHAEIRYFTRYTTRPQLHLFR
jgi:hypothetical protein